MEYRRFGDTLIVRIDRGEEILRQLRQIAQKEEIRLAEVSGLGAVSDFTISMFKASEKTYYANRFTGDYEIVSITGTISTMRDEYYAHVHMSASDEKGMVVGGHLNEAKVSATCEMVVRVIGGEIDHAMSGEIGLNLIAFKD